MDAVEIDPAIVGKKTCPKLFAVHEVKSSIGHDAWQVFKKLNHHTETLRDLATFHSAIWRNSVRQFGVISLGNLAYDEHVTGMPAETTLEPIDPTPLCGRLPPLAQRRPYATAIGAEEVHRPWRLQ